MEFIVNLQKLMVLVVEGTCLHNQARLRKSAAMRRLGFTPDLRAQPQLRSFRPGVYLETPIWFFLGHDLF